MLYSEEKITFAAMIGFYLGQMSKPTDNLDTIDTALKIKLIAKSHELARILNMIDSEQFYEDTERYAKQIYEEEVSK